MASLVPSSSCWRLFFFNRPDDNDNNRVAFRRCSGGRLMIGRKESEGCALISCCYSTLFRPPHHSLNKNSGEGENKCSCSKEERSVIIIIIIVWLLLTYYYLPCSAALMMMMMTPPQLPLLLLSLIGVGDDCRNLS